MQTHEKSPPDTDVHKVLGAAARAAGIEFISALSHLNHEELVQAVIMLINGILVE